MFFYRAHQQNGKRPEEAPDHQQHAQRPPRLGIAGQKVLRFLRHVRIPDEHVLAKTDVGPKNTEGEHPFPHDVIMLERDHVVQIAGLTQGADHKHEQRHGAAGRARKDVNAKHR